MDSTQTFTAVDPAAMWLVRNGNSQLLLPGGARVSGEPLLPALARRGVYAASLLWRAQNDVLAAIAALCGGTQAGAPIAASHGLDGRLSQATFESQSLAPQAVSLLVEGVGHRAAQSSLEHRHYLYPSAGWVCLSGGGHRLVQPLRAGLGVVDQSGS